MIMNSAFTPAIKAATTPTPAAAGGAATSATASSSSGATAGASAVSLGGTDFLTLMLAQLKNQDPTSPVDSNAFLTQLAQLSQVQGITQLNTSFSALSNSLTSSQALQASSLLGHQALVQSSTASVTTPGSTITGAIQVPQNSANVSLTIADPSGAVVQSIYLGAQPAGLTDFSWNGKLADGSTAAAGTYTLKATVQGTASGTAVGTFVNGTVESVTMGSSASGSASGGLTLNIAGLGSVPFSSVTQISN